MAAPGKGNALMLGFGVVVVAAALSLLLLHPRHLVTGLIWGVGIAYAGLILYAALLPIRTEGKGSFLLKYLSGAALRYAAMVGLFCLTVFLVKVNAIGLLLGIFAGMMASTFFFLNKMRVSRVTSGRGSRCK